MEIDIPESAFSVLKVEPAQFAKEMRLAAAVKWYELGMISQSKAASVAGISREEFVEAAGRLRVSIVQVDSEELQQELSRD